MKYFQHKFILLVASVALLVGASSCQDEGYEDVSGTESQTLWEVISSRSDLSQFATVLRQNGYDELLSSSGNFTVLAPVNGQLSQVESDKLSEVPGAHIAPLSYNYTALKSILDKDGTLTMYNGRQALLSEFCLTDEEIVCRNGFLRFAQGTSSSGQSIARTTQQNIYERLIELSDQYEMAAFITSLGDSVMDTDRSVQIGIDENNQPVYDTVRVFTNPLFDYVPYNSNDSLFSILLLDNDNWNALVNKYSRYFRQHVDASGNADLLNASKDANFGYGGKWDSVATAYTARVELIQDLAFSYAGATLTSSKNNPSTVGQVYTARSGVEVTMDSATIADKLLASNGRIEIASGVKVKLANNKIKDVYVEAEDYYYTNETYLATLIDPRFRGSRYVKTYGIDSLRSYTRYVTDSLGNRVKDIHGNDTTEVVSAQLRYVYNTSQYSGKVGGSVIGYKVKLNSCNYRIQWRHVVPGDQGSDYCAPDVNDVTYAKYAENSNYPVGGVLRHIQKMYLSQPGDAALEYTSDVSKTDFILNAYPYNSYSSYTYYRCLTDYDPEAAIGTNANNDEVTKYSNFFRMGVNAGYGVDDPDYETPLVWCETSKDHPKGTLVDEYGNTISTSYCSGITAVSTRTTWVYNKKGVPVVVPRDIFMCLYNGEATVFVTSNPFGTSNTAAAANLTNMKGSIFLDYIHFIPVIDEDD